MARYPFSKNRSRGFTVIEVLIASAVMAIGMAGAAAFIGGAMGSTARSGYMTQAATLASEKLEQLNQYPSADPNVVVSTGSTVGSLTTDASASAVYYYDTVYFSPTQGALEETYSGVDSNGNVTYSTVDHQPDGTVTTTTSPNPPSGTGTVGFERRWIIEGGAPVAGVSRITVLVTLLNQAVQPPVKFQMSIVRPAVYP